MAQIRRRASCLRAVAHLVVGEELSLEGAVARKVFHHLPVLRGVIEPAVHLREVDADLLLRHLLRALRIGAAVCVECVLLHLRDEVWQRGAALEEDELDVLVMNPAREVRRLLAGLASVGGAALLVPRPVEVPAAVVVEPLAVAGKGERAAG